MKTIDGNQSEREPQSNIFRDTPLRYLGYANEVGESFRYQFPFLVVPSYVVAFSYCILDSASVGYTTWTNYDARTNSRSREVHTSIATCDAMIWQTLASVLVPGYTINMLVKASRLVVSRTPILPVFAAAWLPTAVGLGSIPFIVKPIDHAVDAAMDVTIRQWLSEDETRS
jgi:mitochondrial fission process protein 1